MSGFNSNTTNTINPFDIDALNASIGQTTDRSNPDNLNPSVRRYRGGFAPPGLTSRAAGHSLGAGPRPPASGPMSVQYPLLAGPAQHHAPLPTRDHVPPAQRPPPNITLAQSQHVAEAKKWQNHFTNELQAAMQNPTVQALAKEDVEAAAILLSMGRPEGGEGEVGEGVLGREAIAFGVDCLVKGVEGAKGMRGL